MSLTPPDFLEQDRPAGAHDYARRMAFLTELDSQTWIARYTAAERLGDPAAVSSPAAYAAWLRRVAAAWSAVPMPTTTQAASVWPFAAISPLSLDAAGQVEADLREQALAGGGPRTSVTTRSSSGANATSSAASLAASLAGSSTGSIATMAGMAGHAAAMEDVDAAYVCGAAYVAVVTSAEVAVLAADVEHLSATQARTPLPQHYVRHCTQVAAVRTIVRRELADWAAAAGPDPAERVVLAARMLCEHLSTALTHAPRPGW
jgi:hypothetical protein